MRGLKLMVLFLGVGFQLRAESPSMLLSLLPLMAGVVGGRQTAEIPSIVQLQRSDGKLCTGLLYEGACLLTAQHCAKKGTTYKVFGTSAVGEPPAMLTRASRFVGFDENAKGDNDVAAEKDIALFVLDVPLSEKAALGPASLAEKRFTIDETKPTYATIIGYGVYGTEETPNPKLAAATLRDVGAGIKRNGRSIVLGYGEELDAAALLGRLPAKKGNVLWTARGPNIAGPGDSGGPLIDEHNKIQGIASGNLIMAKDADRPLADEILSARYASVPDLREKILEQAKALQCAAHSVESLDKTMLVALRSSISPKKTFRWESLEGKAKAVFDTALRRRLAILPDEDFEILPMRSAAGTVKFTIGVARKDAPDDDDILGPLILDLR